MRKLLEKPLFHYTLVLTCVAIACGFAIGGVNAITAPIIEQNIIDAKAEAFNLVLPGIVSYDELSVVGDLESIQSKVIGKNANGQVIGYIYEAFGTNKFGSMRLVVGVDPYGTIVGADFIEIQQTYQVNDTRSNLALFVGTAIADLEPSGDIIAGATYSYDLAKSLLEDISVTHASTYVAPAQPYELWFGVNYTLENDTAFIATSEILEKYNVKDGDNQVIGTFYHLRGLGVYDGIDNHTGTINMYIGLDLDENILGIDLPKDEFGHTTTAQFYGKVISYVHSMTGNSIHSFGGDSDLVAGASNSGSLVNSLLSALSEVLE